MNRMLRMTVEKALAFAYAAAERPTAYAIWEAKTYSAEVLRRVAKLSSPYREADLLLLRVSELRALLAALNRALDREDAPAN